MCCCSLFPLAEQEESPLPPQEPKEEEEEVTPPKPETPTAPATYSIGEQSIGEDGVKQEVPTCVQLGYAVMRTFCCGV